MSHFSCLIQQDSRADAARAELESRLAAHHDAHFPGEQTTVSWRAAEAGYMFTEGRQSTSSVIQCQLNHPTDLALREQYMRGVCDLWTDITGCTDHEIVVSITENATA